MNVAFMIGALGIFERLIYCTLLFIKQKTAEDWDLDMPLPRDWEPGMLLARGRDLPTLEVFA
jgi:hypothetical protein